MLLKIRKKSAAAFLLSCLMVLSAASCSGEKNNEKKTSEQESTVSITSEQQSEEKKTDKNGEVYILYTSDVHCGIDQGFGYAGLKQMRDSLEAKGYETILVDDGDSIQGEFVGTMDNGETIISLMNDLKYDVAIPGNHEFDYGMENYLSLTKKAAFPYISCNFTYNGNTVFDPYVIKEAAGIKIAFVGVDTPTTITSSTPSFFKDENGNFVYGFMQDETGEAVYEAVQKAVDSARAEGADLVYLMGHLGNSSSYSPWNYADVLSHTNGIDVMLDGHSHDTDQVVMKNKDGKDVVRSACGTKLEAIGYSHITADKKISETNIWKWSDKKSDSEFKNINNEITEKVNKAVNAENDMLKKVVARSEVDLTIYDPTEKDSTGSPLRINRIAEVNIGDFCTDAFRAETKAQIALLGGGGIRKSIEKGDVTYEDVYNVMPYGSIVCVIKVSGQQILDALEWSVHSLPDSFGGFLQVSGISFEVDTSVKTGCNADANGMMTDTTGERRVSNVLVDGKPIDPNEIYTVAGTDYYLLDNGDGFTSFDGAEIVSTNNKTDLQVTIDYIQNELGGVIGDTYADPYGHGRIVIK